MLQGGGALGAYQAGVYEALAAGQLPHWVAGISIGAINAALIVGNPPELRVARLRELWDTMTSSFPLLASPARDDLRSTMNDGNAMLGALFGLPGFFAPRFPPAPVRLPGTGATRSFYDTAATRLRFAPWFPSRSRSRMRSSSTSSSACRIRPASAITPSPAR